MNRDGQVREHVRWMSAGRDLGPVTTRTKALKWELKGSGRIGGSAVIKVARDQILQTIELHSHCEDLA